MEKATLTRESLRHALRTIQSDREVQDSREPNLFSKQVLNKIESDRRQNEHTIVEAVISELFDEYDEDDDAT